MMIICNVPFIVLKLSLYIYLESLMVCDPTYLRLYFAPNEQLQCVGLV